MSDDTRGNVGLHCRLKVESVAKYHADEQDTTKAPCNSTSDYESKKRGEGCGSLARKGTTGAIAGGAKEAPKKGSPPYCIAGQHEKRGWIRGLYVLLFRLKAAYVAVMLAGGTWPCMACVFRLGPP